MIYEIAGCKNEISPKIAPQRNNHKFNFDRTNFLSDFKTIIDQQTKRIDINTGQIQGPNHALGIKNRISHSVQEIGHPMVTFNQM